MNEQNRYLEKVCQFEFEEGIKLRRYTNLEWVFEFDNFNASVENEFNKKKFVSFEEGFREYEIYRLRKQYFKDRAVLPRLPGVKYTYWYIHLKFLSNGIPQVSPKYYNTELLDWFEGKEIPLDGVFVPVPVEEKLHDYLGHGCSLPF